MTTGQSDHRTATVCRRCSLLLCVWHVNTNVQQVTTSKYYELWLMHTWLLAYLIIVLPLQLLAAAARIYPWYEREHKAGTAVWCSVRGDGGTIDTIQNAAYIPDTHFSLFQHLERSLLSSIVTQSLRRSRCRREIARSPGPYVSWSTHRKFAV